MEITYRSTEGWKIRINAITQTASLRFFNTEIKGVKVFGSTKDLSPYSKLEVSHIDSHPIVVIPGKGVGGGCISCTQNSKKVIPIVSSIVPIGGNPQVQALAEAMLTTPLPLHDFETIEPHLLQNGYKIGEFLMKKLQDASFWDSSEHYKYRHRILSLCRKFLLSYILSQIRKIRTLFIDNIDIIKMFFYSIEKITEKREADFDSHLEAKLFGALLNQSFEWAEWYFRIEREGSNIFSAYFGGPALQSNVFILKRLEEIYSHDLYHVNLLMILDQLAFAKERLIVEIICEMIKDGYHKDLNSQYIVLTYLETLIGTGKISEDSFEALINPVKLHLRRSKHLDQKAYSILLRISRTPQDLYFLRKISERYDITLIRNCFENINKLQQDNVILLPNQSGPAFVGRKKDLRTISTFLANNNKVTIYGKNGVGKSRLVHEYALSHIDEYDLIAWMNTTVPFWSYNRLGRCFPLSLIEDQELKIEQIKVYMMKHFKKSLLVFDDAVQDVSKFLPYSGHAIVITTNKQWKHNLKIKGLSYKKALNFIEDPDSNESLNIYKGVPITLTHLKSAWKFYPEFTLPEFNETIKERLSEIKTDPFLIITKKKLNSMRREKEKLGEFLNYLAFLHPSRIPAMMIEEILKILGLSSLSVFIKLYLKSNHFIDINPDGSIQMIKMISDITISEIVFRERYTKTLTTIFHGLVSSTYAYENSNKQSSCFDEWYVHFEHFFSKYTDYPRSEYMESLLYYAHLKLNHHKSLKNLWITEFQLGEKLTLYMSNYDLSKAHILFLYIKLNENSTSDLSNFYMCVLLQQEKFVGAKHIELAESLHYLAKAELSQNMRTEAMEHQQEAIDMLTHIYPSGHLSIAEFYETVAEIHNKNKNSIDEVIRFFEISLDIKRKYLFKYDPSFSRSYRKLAEVYIHRNSLSDAILYLAKSLENLEEFYSPKHFYLITDLAHIAHCYHLSSNTDDAASYYKRALKILKENCTKNDPNVLRIYNKLAVVSFAAGDEDKSRHYQEKGQQLRNRLVTKELNESRKSLNIDRNKKSQP